MDLLWLINLGINTLIKILPALLFLIVFPLIGVWYERKLLARVMLRIGPLHVGKYAGWLQLIADFLKLEAKEIIIPAKSNKNIFIAAPIAAMVVSSIPLAVIPFDNNTVVFKFDLNLLFVFAMASLVPLVILLTGWASNSKYSFFGGLRIVFQMLAYEIPLILSVLGVVVLTRSFDLVQISNAQSKIWFGLIQPLGLLVFFIATIAELERLPFDIPTAEQEIVIGWMTEYTGLPFGLFMMSGYICFGVHSLLITIIFLGGWSGPAFLPPMAWLMLKVVIVATLIMVMRGTYPRVRLDQLLKFGWQILIPLAVINILWSILISPIVLGVLA
mgnify:CR=1 FL=1